MKKPLLDFRIPTVIGIAAVAISIWVTGTLVRQGTEMVGQASADIIPENISITNVYDNTFTLVFTTQDPAVAAISIKGEDLQETVIFQDSSRTPRTTHQIEVPNLSSTSTYTFSILLEGNTYLDQGKPYSVTTGPTLTASEIPLSVSGSVSLPDGSPAENALVIFSSENSQKLSTTTDAQGIYTFTTPLLRSKDLKTAYIGIDGDPVLISVYKESLASTVSSRFGNIFEIPDITLTENYDFSTVALDETTTESASFVLPTPNTTTSGVAISYPTTQASLIDAQPLFRGTGTKGTAIQVSLSPSRITQSVTVDTTGRWQFRPTVSLPQGQNTLVVSGQDAAGRSRTARVNFSIFPAGSQIAQSATPSATLTPTLTPTQMVTASPTPIVTTTISPSPIASSSPTTTPSLTNTPTPTVTVTPLPTQPVLSVTPTPPGSLSTILITAVSAILIVTGTTLLFILG